MAQSSIGRYDVLNGPGKDDLKASVFDRKVVTFQIRKSKTSEVSTEITVIVLGVQQEDGSCESWIIQGYVTDGSMKAVHFNRGYYSTKNRRGYMDLWPTATAAAQAEATADTLS